MESGILKTIIIILSFFMILFIAFMSGILFTKTSKETSKQEILGELNFSAKFYCEQEEREDNKKVSLIKQECELINNPSVKFIIENNCQQKRNGVLCVGNIRPLED